MTIASNNKSLDSLGRKVFYAILLMTSRMIWVTFLKGKTKHFEKFKNFKSLVENECGHKIKCLRFDNGGELTSKYFN